MNKELSPRAQELMIELAKELGLNKEETTSIKRTCEDCFFCTHNDGMFGEYPDKNFCFHNNKIRTTPSDPDDMSYQDYIENYLIEDIVEAMTCNDFKSKLEMYKELYEKTQKELDELKTKIKDLCS